MTTLNIAGRRVKVDDSFKSLSPDEQNAAVEDIAKSLGNSPAIKAPIREAPAAGEAYSGSILPFSRDTEGNVSFDSNAGIVGAVKRAITAPGRAMSGELQVTGPDGSTSPQAIEEATNFAGVFGPASPAAGTGRALAEAAAARRTPGMETAVSAQRLGVDLPRAVASDSASVQQTGKVLTNVPIGGTPLRKASQNAIDQLGDAATRVQDGYGPGNVAQAGAAAREGITGHAKVLGQRVSDAYSAVDDLITQNVTTPLEKTGKVALDIASSRENSARAPSAAVSRIQKALKREGGLNYQGIKDLRTDIGETLDDPALIVASGASQAELKRIYGALSEDLRNAVARGGGERATKAFETANQLAAKTSREREALQRVLGKDISDERLFDRITSMAGSTARADRVSLARVRGAVGDDTWNELASGVISRLGRDPDGNFSPDRFITGYGKLSQEGKSALFGGKKDLSQSLDDIASVSRRFKQLNQYANPSGTAQSSAGIGYLGGMFVDPTTVVGSIVGARVMSSILAKPVGAKALSAYAKAYERQATKPNKVASQALTNTARAVAALVANEAGDKTISAQIFPQIVGVRKVPAEQGNEDSRRKEGQDGGVNNQPRFLAPNEI